MHCCGCASEQLFYAAKSPHPHHTLICSGKANGTAFVQFEEPEGAQEALQKYNNVALDGKPMRIEFDEGSSDKVLSSGLRYIFFAMLLSLLHLNYHNSTSCSVLNALFIFCLWYLFGHSVFVNFKAAYVCISVFVSDENVCM